MSLCWILLSQEELILLLRELQEVMKNHPEAYYQLQMTFKGDEEGNETVIELLDDDDNSLMRKRY